MYWEIVTQHANCTVQDANDVEHAQMKIEELGRTSFAMANEEMELAGDKLKKSLRAILMRLHKLNT